MKLSQFVLLLTCSLAAIASRAEEAAPSTQGGATAVVEKVEKAIEHGAKAAASGVERGVKVAASGVERGVKAAASGVQRGARAAASGVQRGAKATADAADSAAKKVGGTGASGPSN